jgi:hypothetical protein
MRPPHARKRAAYPQVGAVFATGAEERGKKACEPLHGKMIVRYRFVQGGKIQ